MDDMILKYYVVYLLLYEMPGRFVDAPAMVPWDEVSVLNLAPALLK